MGELAKIDSFRREVAIAESIEEMQLLTIKGDLLAEMARKLEIPLKGQNVLGRTRVELAAKLREVIEVKFPKGGDRKSKSKDLTLILTDAGITKNESSDAKIIKEEEEIVEVVMNEIEKEKDIITPKKVAAKVRKKKKEIKKKGHEKISNSLDVISNISPDLVNIKSGWHKIGNQLLYCGSNLDLEFINHLPHCKFAFADPPYNAGVAEWDSNFKWQHDYIQDISDVIAVTPGGWNTFNFYNETKMNYIWEMACWIKNGMTHGKCGFANFIKTSIFSKYKVKIPQDFWEISIKTNETEDTNHKGRKPYNFMIHLIDLFSSKGDSIIDLFAGSGTTLLISEKMERISYNAEINIYFCNEIIRRGIKLGMKYEQL